MSYNIIIIVNVHLELAIEKHIATVIAIKYLHITLTISGTVYY